LWDSCSARPSVSCWELMLDGWWAVCRDNKHNFVSRRMQHVLVSPDEFNINIIHPISYTPDDPQKHLTLEVVGGLVGLSVGASVGSSVGGGDGGSVGSSVGDADGLFVVLRVGLSLGGLDGRLLGDALGDSEGLAVGKSDGDALGLAEGLAVGPLVGACVVVSWSLYLTSPYLREVRGFGCAL